MWCSGADFPLWDPCRIDKKTKMSEIARIKSLMIILLRQPCASVDVNWSFLSSYMCCMSIDCTHKSDSFSFLILSFVVSFSHANPPSPSPTSYSCSLHPAIPLSKIPHVNGVIRCCETVSVSVPRGTYMWVCTSHLLRSCALWFLHLHSNSIFP